MDTLTLITSLVAAGAVVLVSYGVWSVSTADRERVAWRVSRTGIGHRRAAPGADLRVEAARTSRVFSPIDRALMKYGWLDKTRTELQKADVHLHPSEFIFFRLIASLGVFGVALLIALSSHSLLIGLIGLGIALAIWWQAGAYVRRRINRRQASVEAHLDEALIAISGSLRAGFSFLQACQMSINQLQWPLNQEVSAMLEDVNVGAALEDALRAMARRIESYEVDIAVNAVLVQRQVGGNLAEILDNVARTIRERRELHGHIMALTAQQRLSAYFVAGVPVFMAGLLSVISWQFMKPLYLTTTGNVLMAIGLGLDMLGFLLMRRLARIDF